MVSASELREFVYCERAWLLSRQGFAVSQEVQAQRKAGISFHEARATAARKGANAQVLWRALIGQLRESSAGFRSLIEAMDRTTPRTNDDAKWSRRLLNSSGLCSGRDQGRLDVARQNGRVGGRRPKLSSQQRAEIRRMVSKDNKMVVDAYDGLQSSR
jgi:hypothetical protein